MNFLFATILLCCYLLWLGATASIPVARDVGRGSFHRDSSTIDNLSAITQVANESVPSGGRGDTAPQAVCVELRDWTTLPIQYQDCLLAVENFKQQTDEHDEKLFEFLARGAAPTQGQMVQSIQTPLSFQSGSCTLAIIMQSEFKQGTLPLAGSEEEKPTGLEDFRTMARIAEKLVVDCIYTKDRPGWHKIGVELNIGLFLINPNSAFAKRIPLNSQVDAISFPNSTHGLSASIPAGSVGTY